MTAAQSSALYILLAGKQCGDSRAAALETYKSKLLLDDIMKAVQVRFVSAEIAAFNARDEHLEKQLRLTDPTLQAAEIIKDVRDRLKKAHASGPSYDDDPLAGLVNVTWAQDEEVVHERLAKFLAAVREKIRNAQRKGVSYYDLERQIMAAKIGFD
jgi:predicted DNA-binding protein (UPF0278 family)